MNAAFAWCRAACHFGSSLLAQLALTGWAWSLPPAAVAADFAVNGYSLNGGNNSVLATAVDATGNSVVAGIFNGDTATFGSISLPRIGNQDAFVVKRDASGTVLWAKNFGGIGADAYGQGIALDGSGNVFLGGSFYNSNLTTPALSKIGVNDAFAVKLDSNGNTVWSKNFGGSGASAVGLSIAVDGGGNVALSGYFDNANLTTPALTKIGISDAFAFKLDSSGNTTWAKNFGGSGAFARGTGIAVDGGGNVALSGFFYSANLTNPALSMIGFLDAFALKLDSSGNTGWAKNWGGSGAFAATNGIAVDGNGNVLLGGNFSSASLTTPALGIVGSTDAFALKLDSGGNTAWAKNFGGSGASAVGNGIAVDGSGNVYLGGYFNGANLTTPALTRMGSQDDFLIRLPPITVPGAANIGTATAGNMQATVTFTAPDINGGSTITVYTATSNPSGVTGTCANSPCTISGLANGTAYNFTVTATNAAGTGAASTVSNSVTPKVPQAITFANPDTQIFGTSPTLTASASSGLAVILISLTTGVCTISAGGTLTFLATGTCIIAADQIGNANYAAAPQVTQSFSVNATVPGAPTIGTATAGNGQATVTFTAPADNGGSAVTGYTASSSPGSFTGTCAASPCTVTGLANGTAYTVTVTATNAAGTGAASTASNSVTPKASQTISFAHPGDQIFGTSPTLTASASSGLAVSLISLTTGVCTITTGGTLTFLATGTCSISANQIGNGVYTAAPQVTLIFSVNATVPGAPTIGTATAGNGQATVTFTAPANTGGAAISNYTGTCTASGQVTRSASSSTSPVTVGGLTGGVEYNCSLTATNAGGLTSIASGILPVTPAPAKKGISPLLMYLLD